MLGVGLCIAPHGLERARRVRQEAPLLVAQIRHRALGGLM